MEALVEEKKSDVIVGKHLYANLYGIDRERGWDEEGLREVVVRAAKASNMTLLEVKSWKLGGGKGGVSVIALVLESHIAVHTWPWYGYATVDVYTCGEKSDPSKGIKLIIDFRSPEYYTMGYADRTQRPRPVTK
jgi:S-adenosylmethionine decarboxylase